MRSQPVNPYSHRSNRGVPAIVGAVAAIVMLALVVGLAALAGRAAASERPGAPTFTFHMKAVPLDLGHWDYSVKRAWLCGSLKATLDGRPVVRSWVRHTTDRQGRDRYVLMPGRGAMSDPRMVRRCTDVFRVLVRVDKGAVLSGPPVPHR